MKYNSSYNRSQFAIDHRLAARDSIQALFNIKARNGSESEYQKYSSKSFRTKHTKSVEALYNSIEQTGCNPFFGTEEHCNQTRIVNIASGKMADELTTRDLLRATSLGQEKRDSFIKDVLSLSGTGSYSSPIKKENLNTFARNQANKHVKTSKNGKPIPAVSRTEDFLLLISSYQYEDPIVSVEHALCYPLQDIPAMMGNADGSFYPSNKSVLKSILSRYSCIHVIVFEMRNISIHIYFIIF